MGRVTCSHLLIPPSGSLPAPRHSPAAGHPVPPQLLHHSLQGHVAMLCPRCVAREPTLGRGRWSGQVQAGDPVRASRCHLHGHLGK